VLADKNIGNNTQSIPMFDDSKLKIDRGMMATEKDIQAKSKDGIFPRFTVTENGISTRSIPGQRGGIFWMTGDEHDAIGHIDESSANRVPMQEKRMRKLETAAREIPDDFKVKMFGDKNADVTIVTWGSPKGAIIDALPKLQKAGIKANLLQVHLIWPFPTEAVTKALKNAKLVIGVEMNYTAQLCTLIRRETGIEIKHRILKFNGRPISETEIVDGVSEIHKKHTEKVVLTGGL
jgi:2-oxoglutarate ferredoxin oxidoreductase subunit alpha